MQRRVVIEDALKHVYEILYRGQIPTVESLAGILSLTRDEVSALIGELEVFGYLVPKGGSFDLTAEGRDYALQVIRAHRLYETYLAQEKGHAPVDWHHEADLKEHELSSKDLEKISNLLGDPRFDPHGDPIPTPEGEMPPLRGRYLLECPKGWEGRVVHIEDEPESVYKALVAANLSPCMKLRIAEKNKGEIKILSEGREIHLSLAMAGNIMVTDLAEDDRFEEGATPLSYLKEGEEAYVIGLSASFRGLERRRLLDLGLVPGSVITKELTGALRDPVAYKIRGALVALRREQAERILVRRKNGRNGG